MSEMVTLDAAWFRSQAIQAVRQYFAPFGWVVKMVRAAMDGRVG